ncbi:dUTP diphosphatase [candidate division CSSED10-310 bacterium]|uniref:Deoxyuridine 5'-triphosphate nucleotidohydrolase n=1 Tax=candidate division CSSED10-310 bacterium TaxID=2855610 RepID=A0ABV6YVC5_UNCC1
MDELEISIKEVRSYPKKLIPTPSTVDSAGMDLIAALDESLILQPGERTAVPTGIAIALPRGFEGQVRPRSGLALHFGITVLNTPGTIDSDYRGEIKVILINLGSEAYQIKPGERIAQLVISSYHPIQWRVVSHLPPTIRNDGGFGHTGS